VYVYNQKVYNEKFEINILDQYNISTSENLKNVIFIEVWNLKYGSN
jgi:hypothetical protein